MDREKLRLTENQVSSIVSENYHNNPDIEDFEKIESIHRYHDGEKGFSEFDLIIQRISDEKFFKGSYSEWSAGSCHYNLDFEEVFPKQITKTIYT